MKNIVGNIRNYKTMNEELKELYNQYIYEKSLVEMWGYQSVLTFEEWLEMKQKNYEWIREIVMKNKKQ